MVPHSNEQADADSYYLQRFVEVQRASYSEALAEIRSGRKRSHWTWFILPQVAGLGSSAMSRRYALRSVGPRRRPWPCVLSAPCRSVPQVAAICPGCKTQEVTGAPDPKHISTSPAVLLLPFTIMAALFERDALQAPTHFEAILGVLGIAWIGARLRTSWLGNASGAQPEFEDDPRNDQL